MSDKEEARKSILYSNPNPFNLHVAGAFVNGFVVNAEGPFFTISQFLSKIGFI